jgi:tripartite-type tricarboxylate transporter receptor subunit TctC
MNRLLTAVLRCASAASAVTLVAFASSACAQGYPNKPIRLIVPYPAGGTTDILAREIGQKLAESLKQPVVVDNRPGANGNIGAQAVATAAPDGYTLLMAPAGTLTSNPHLYATMPFDALKSFAPITIVAETAHIVVVNPAMPAKSMQELIALAKAKPGELTFASPGTGSSPHLSGELFKTMTGVNITHVPYKGAAPAVNDLLGGVVTMSFDTVPSSAPHVKAGKLKALAVTSAKRLPQFPDVPTVAESGVAGYESTTWFGLLAPAKTPQDIIDKLHAEVVKTMQTADMKERFAKQGAEPVGNTPEQFAGVLKAETAKWGKVIKDSGVRLE